MGFFNSEEKLNIKATLAYNDCKKYLKAKDGLLHVAMFSIPLKDQCALSIDPNYTIQIDEIITNMQVDGYEI